MNKNLGIHDLQEEDLSKLPRINQSQRAALEDALLSKKKNPLLSIEYAIYENGKLNYMLCSDECNIRPSRDQTEGPAILEWYENGLPERTAYYENAALHRDPRRGFAIQGFYPNGDVSEERYYWEGHQVNAYFIPPEDRPVADGLGRVFI